MTDPAPVRQLFSAVQPGDPGPEADDLGPAFVEMVKALSRICATRMLLLVTVLTGAAIWGYATVDPTRDRLFVAVAFSIVFVLPQILLSWKQRG